MVAKCSTHQQSTNCNIPKYAVNSCVFTCTEFSMPSRKCLACGQYFKPCPQTREQRYCSKSKCQNERRRRSKEKQRKSEYSSGYDVSQSGAITGAYLSTNDTISPQLPETSNTGQLPPGRYLLRRLDGDGIAKGHAWLAEIRILSAFPEDG